MTALRPNAAAPPRPCPICGKPAVPTCAPFCSPRCADVDLHHWLYGAYAIPVPPPAEEDDTADAPLREPE